MNVKKIMSYISAFFIGALGVLLGFLFHNSRTTDSVENRISDIKNTSDGIGNSVDGIKQSVSDIDSTVSGIKQSVSDITGTKDSIRESSERIENILSEIENQKLS